jgi:hypothetical protein
MRTNPHSPWKVLLVLAGLLVLAAAPGVTDGPRAVYGEQDISLGDVRAHHCHDGTFPVIRCFDTAEERDADAGLGQPLGDGSDATGTSVEAALMAVFYVTFWEHSGYGGSSFTTSLSQPDLRDIGWNDAISSFKSLNGQRPKWFSDVAYGPPYWQWSAGSNVSYVGDSANDRFSSVKNVP